MQLSGGELLIVKADKTNTVLPLIGLLDLEFCMFFSHVHIGVRLVPIHGKRSCRDSKLVIIIIIMQGHEDTMKNLIQDRLSLLLLTGVSLVTRKR